MSKEYLQESFQTKEAKKSSFSYRTSEQEKLKRNQSFEEGFNYCVNRENDDSLVKMRYSSEEPSTHSTLLKVSPKQRRKSSVKLIRSGGLQVYRNIIQGNNRDLKLAAAHKIYIASFR